MKCMLRNERACDPFISYHFKLFRVQKYDFKCKNTNRRRFNLFSFARTWKTAVFQLILPRNL
jgi:hypothetical protein